jgi:protein-S-isoprenylcysteine O-methyltransferase Ste14
MWRFALRLVLMFGLMAAALFLCAGRIDLPFFWAFLGILLGAVIVGLRVIDPGLMRERLQPGAGGVDRNLRIAAVPFFAAHLVVAGLDVGRFQWSGVIPPAWQIIALAALGLAMSLSMWAMHVNRYFSPVVRIQSERGHEVVTRGPYRFVRHPGYAAALVMMPAGGIGLGSLWSMVPLIPVMAMILRRVLIEDRFLHRELPGYVEYAMQTRSRLIPGIW